jgi:hypothetical protein
MFSVMIFIFLVFVAIVSVLFYMTRVFGQQYNSLREELTKTQDMLRTFEARLSASPENSAVNPQPGAGCAMSDYAVDSPLSMIDPDKSLKPGIADSPLDLHFDLETKDEPAAQRQSILK